MNDCSVSAGYVKRQMLSQVDHIGLKGDDLPCCVLNLFPSSGGKKKKKKNYKHLLQVCRKIMGSV